MGISSATSCSCLPGASKRHDLLELQRSTQANRQEAEALRDRLLDELAACQAKASEAESSLGARSREMEAQLAKARVVISEIQCRNATLELQPTGAEIEKERKKVLSEFQRKSNAMERTMMEELEVQRRMGADLQKGQASITALEVRVSSLSQAGESLGRQVATCRQKEADVQVDRDTLEETITRLKG